MISIRPIVTGPYSENHGRPARVEHGPLIVSDTLSISEIAKAVISPDPSHLSLPFLEYNLHFQAFGNCWAVDSSGLKDPRLHESAKISCLYNMARLESEKGEAKVGGHRCSSTSQCCGH